MSAERLEQSLRELRATADRLEAGSLLTERAVTEPVLIEPAVSPAAVSAVADGPKARRAGRSTKRIVVGTVAHTAATVALLVAVSALVDPLLPHPDRPRLSESVSAVVDVGDEVLDIPANTADRP